MSPRFRLPLRLQLRLLTRLRRQAQSPLQRTTFRRPVRQSPLPPLTQPTASVKIVRTMKIPTAPQGDHVGEYIRVLLFHSISFTKSKYRLIKKPRRLAHIPIPTAEQSPVPKFEAYFLLAPLRRADRVSYPLASETVAEVAQMIKGLDVKDPVEANRETSFPRKDYTPYVTYVDCRDQGGPSSRPGSPRG